MLNECSLFVPFPSTSPYVEYKYQWNRKCAQWWSQKVIGFGFFDFCFFWFFLHHLYLGTRELTEFHMGGWSSKNCFDHRPICAVPHLVTATVFCWACYHLWLSFLVQPSDQSSLFRDARSSGLLQATKCLSTTSWKPLKFRLICLTKQQKPLEEWSWCPGILKVCGPSHKHEIAYTLRPKANIFVAFQDTYPEIPPSDAFSLPSVEALCGHLERALNSFTIRLTVPSQGMSTRPSYSLVWQTLTWQQCRRTIKELHP